MRGAVRGALGPAQNPMQQVVEESESIWSPSSYVRSVEGTHINTKDGVIKFSQIKSVTSLSSSNVIELTMWIGKNRRIHGDWPELKQVIDIHAKISGREHPDPVVISGKLESVGGNGDVVLGRYCLGNINKFVLGQDNSFHFISGLDYLLRDQEFRITGTSEQMAAVIDAHYDKESRSTTGVKYTLMPTLAVKGGTLQGGDRSMRVADLTGVFYNNGWVRVVVGKRVYLSYINDDQYSSLLSAFRGLHSDCMDGPYQSVWNESVSCVGAKLDMMEIEMQSGDTLRLIIN